MDTSEEGSTLILPVLSPALDLLLGALPNPLCPQIRACSGLLCFLPAESDRFTRLAIIKPIHRPMTTPTPAQIHGNRGIDESAIRLLGLQSH